MTLLVDTSVWSLALRRDVRATVPEVDALRDALLGGAIVVTTGLVLQELLQGFSGPNVRTQIIDRFTALALLQPERDDHIAAADLRNTCRRAGVQLGTIDALLARLCIRHDLTLLTTDGDFALAGRYVPLRVWSAPGAG
ncbi:MAG: PIN domain-containing protein [Trueperaceae bacterium]|nr:PIN domain-containing protein [Trueperaceae bacterium]